MKELTQEQSEALKSELLAVFRRHVELPPTCIPKVTFALQEPAPLELEIVDESFKSGEELDQLLSLVPEVKESHFSNLAQRCIYNYSTLGSLARHAQTGWLYGDRAGVKTKEDVKRCLTALGIPIQTHLAMGPVERERFMALSTKDFMKHEGMAWLNDERAEAVIHTWQTMASLCESLANLDDTQTAVQIKNSGFLLSEEQYEWTAQRLRGILQRTGLIEKR